MVTGNDIIKRLEESGIEKTRKRNPSCFNILQKDYPKVYSEMIESASKIIQNLSDHANSYSSSNTSKIKSISFSFDEKSILITLKD